MSLEWKGVMPAITTAFKDDLSVDHDFIAKHTTWLIDNGCTGIVPLGSLGEGATLSFEEKLEILETCVSAVGSQAPVIAGISSLSTAEAVRLAKGAADKGCEGLMVLPPYVYSTDWREMKAHVLAIIQATGLGCMLYNNPIAYGTDFVAEQIAELAEECENLEAVKESSTDARRVTAIRALLGDRLAVLVGIDDVIVEGIHAGAQGWVGGLVNAFCKESVDLFNFALEGEKEKTQVLYNWFLPLLRLDTLPKFVQLIKLVQQEVGMGNTRVRGPRLELVGDELQQTMTIIKTALQNKPNY